MSNIILFEPRSGSTYLEGCLYYGYPTGTCQKLGEYLNGRDGSLFGMTDNVNRTKNFANLKSMESSYTLRIAPTDYLWLTDNDRKFFDDKEVIVCRRHDKRQQIMSFLYAKRVNKYHYYKNEDASPQLVLAMKEDLEHIITQLDKIDEVAKNLNVTTIYYEDFQNDKGVLLDKFNIDPIPYADYLPVAPGFSVADCFKNKDPVEEWVDEYLK